MLVTCVILCGCKNSNKGSDVGFFIAILKGRKQFIISDTVNFCYGFKRSSLSVSGVGT